MADPDAKPIVPEDLERMKRVPQVKVIRRAFRLSQEDFAAHFHIPIGTLRDWEQGRKEPDAAAKAYLRVIASAPDVVRPAAAAHPEAVAASGVRSRQRNQAARPLSLPKGPRALPRDSS